MFPAARQSRANDSSRKIESMTRAKTVGLAGLLVCMTLAAYLPAVRAGFLWDDDASVCVCDDWTGENPCRSSRSGMDALLPPTLSGCRQSPMVLRGKAGMAGRSDLHLSEVAGRCQSSLAVPFSRRRFGPGRLPLFAARAHRARPVDCGPLFRHRRFPGTRLFQHLSHVVFVRRGSLPIPGKHRTHCRFRGSLHPSLPAICTWNRALMDTMVGVGSTPCRTGNGNRDEEPGFRIHLPNLTRSECDSTEGLPEPA